MARRHRSGCPKARTKHGELMTGRTARYRDNPRVVGFDLRSASVICSAKSVRFLERNEVRANGCQTQAAAFNKERWPTRDGVNMRFLRCVSEDRFAHVGNGRPPDGLVHRGDEGRPGGAELEQSSGHANLWSMLTCLASVEHFCEAFPGFSKHLRFEAFAFGKRI